MSDSNSRRLATRIAATGSVVIAMLGAALPQAARAADRFGLEGTCGYQGWGEYRHCDGGTGSTVMLDVKDIWGNIYLYCVGPGLTDLQPVIRWRVAGAWWNGGVGCAPGYYGPA